WKSPTIAGLKTAAPVTIWTDATASRCCNVWAPEFHLLDGPNGPRWYVYYTAGGPTGNFDNQKMYVLESAGTDPLGPYSFKGRIFDPTNDGWAIDASVLRMPGGALYLLFSAWEGPTQNLYIAPMSDPWTISGSRVQISTPTHDWETSLSGVNEGPEVLQRDGKTFIVYSASACWGPDYKLGMLEYSGGDVLSASSWVKHAEPVFQRSDANGVFGPGHNGFFTSPDGTESWIVYHANSSASGGCEGTRTTRVQEFTWNADGTPNFGTPLALTTPITEPSTGAGGGSAGTGRTATGLATVAVTNVAPTAALANDGPVDEGSAATVGFSAQADPSNADTAAGFHYAFACDGGPLDGASYATSGDSATTTCAFAEDGSYTVRGRIIDKDDGSTEYTTVVAVNNAAPSVGSIGGPADPITLGTAIEVSASYSDPGTTDSHTATWNWGDGTTSPGSVSEANGAGSASGSHTYAAPGVYVVVLTVTDDEGDSASATATYRVAYGFSAFAQPVDNAPAVNLATAGQVIPLKWRLTDASGAPVTTLASVTVTAVSRACGADTVASIEEYAAGESVLQNLGDGYYQYNWKTPKAFAGSCRTLKLDLGEGAGQERIALFQFR
ncbi:MAG TPA: family 43 glycosylhydrolase, partial [Ardenticatenaceae bacterium]|nr:family 43 glycosylhydrolase [Ardenticatenaceae bacterium]